VNEKDTAPELGFDGCELIEGAAVSMVHVYVESGPVEDPLVACTAKVWEPAVRPL
jgi:hypothetical protein